MVRFELTPREGDDGRKIAYGLDHITGIFLSIGNIHFQTNSFGLGECLPAWEMAKKMRDHGVPPGHICQFFGQGIADELFIDQGYKENAETEGKSNVGKSDEGAKDLVVEPNGVVVGECVWCGADARKLCARCVDVRLAVFYCSGECQMEDWNNGGHKLVCGSGTFKNCRELRITHVPLSKDVEIADGVTAVFRTFPMPSDLPPLEENNATEALCAEFFCCANCGVVPSKKRCARCATMFYCSRECQVEDWDKGAHRHFCGIPMPTKTLFEDGIHQVLESAIGLQLPVGADARPRFVEVRYTRGVSLSEGEEEGESGGPHLLLSDLTEHLGAGEAFLGHFMFQNLEKTGARCELRDPLMVLFRSWSRVDGHPPNRCVAGIAGMAWERLPNEWFGPVLVLKATGRELHSTKVLPLKDMEIADGSDVAAFFRSFPREDILAPPIF